MPTEFTLPLIVVLALVVGVGFMVAQRQSKARREALAKRAMLFGLTFIESTPVEELEGLSLHLFEQGSSSAAANAMSGRYRGADLVAFDFEYTTGSGKNRTTHNQTVVLFRPLADRLPRFEMRPEHLFHRIGQIFGYQDIDFPQHEGFSKKYLLRGEDERAVREAFRTYILDHFQNNPGWSLESNGDALLVYRHGKKVKPEEYQKFMDEVAEIREMFR